MNVYKLTNQENKTYGECCWTPGEWKTASGEGELCGPGWLHCYESPEIAVFMNPIHAKINNPCLWLADVRGNCLRDGQLKSGYTKMRIIEKIELPIITTAQRVEIGIRCAMAVCKDDAAGWAAEAAMRAAEAGQAAAAAAADAAVWAARRAAMRAETAAGWAAEAAMRADTVAGWVAEAAGWVGDREYNLNLKKIIRE